MVRIKTKYSEEYDISRIKFYAQIHYKVLATYSQGIFWANIASLQSTFYNISNISASKTYIYRFFSWNTLRGFFFFFHPDCCLQLSVVLVLYCIRLLFADFLKNLHQEISS